MKKQKLTIVIMKKNLEMLKKHSEETGFSVSNVIALAVTAFFKQIEDDKPAQPKPEKVKSRIRQCRNDECFRPYDTNEHDSCPHCGDKETYFEAET